MQKPLGAPVTISKIAGRVGLSQATVSRVLNGKGAGFISDATRERVLNVAREMGYRPNRLARGLVTGRTQVISVWIRNLDRPYYAGILRALQQFALSDGYEIILRCFRDAGAPDDRTPPVDPLAATWPVDGVFAVDTRTFATVFAASDPQQSVPLVGMSSDYLEDRDYVAFDAVVGVRHAVQHLVDIGCRRIAHLSAERSIDRVRRARADTYVEVLRAAGRPPEVITARGESRPEAREAIVNHIRAHGAPDGLFCLNDDMALGAYRAVRDLNLRVPEDVALVGCDGILDTEYLDVPLTTIVQPVEEMCRLAWQVMMRRLQDPAAPIQQILLSPRLLIRESTRRPT